MASVEGLHRRSIRAGLHGQPAVQQPALPRTAQRIAPPALQRTAQPSAHRASPGLSGLSASLRGHSHAAAPLQLHAMAVDFPDVTGHPNRLPFEGVLTLIDLPSDKAPSGARGHRVVLTREAAETALPSLLGMAVGYKAGWDGHDARQKCGIITAAAIEGKRLTVAGYLYARDFPELESRLSESGHAEPAMGMSYELADAHVADLGAAIWRLTRATFTGAAILLREKAAYRNTSFRLKRAAAAATRTPARTPARLSA